MKRVLSAWVIFVASLVFAQEVPANLKTSVPPFDVNDVIKQVHQNQSGFTTGEFLIDTSVVYVPAPNGQYSSAIAFDGTNYLVVWHDMRSNFWDIYGARVNQIGVVLDPAGIAISTAPSSKWLAAVAFDGTNYLVIWEDTRNGLDIYGARVSQEGVVLDPAGIAISTAANSQEDPVVAFDGTNYLVVWQDMRSDSLDIYGARVNQMGVVLDPNGIAISTTASYQSNPSVAFDGTNILVVWHDFRSGSNSDIYGARVGQSGMVLDSAGIAISTTEDWQWSPAVAFDGTNYQIVWGEYRSGPGADIYGARVSINGTVLDTLGFAISTATSSQEYPSIAFDGTNYLVVWEDRRNSDDPDIYGARVSQEGVVLDPNGIAISTAASSQEYPSIAFDGTNYLVAWEDRRNYLHLDIYSARVNRSGTVLDPNGIAISTAASSQEYPSIAFDGTNYLMVWEDRRNSDDPDIYGARVSQEGVVLDPNGIAVTIAPDNQRYPSVSFDGTNYLVVWEDRRNSDDPDIYGARVSQEGVVLDPNGIAISTAASSQGYPSIAFDGTNYLVVWHDMRGNANLDIYGARVSRGGVVLDTNGIAISTVTYSQNFPSVSFDGTNYLVVWEDCRNYPHTDIYGARVSQEGVVLDTNGIGISTVPNSQLSPSIAFDGTNYLVVWEDYRNSQSYSDIYGTRVSQRGAVLDPNGFAISTTNHRQRFPSSVFDGTNYLVVWEDCQNGYNYDIYGARVSPLGIVIDSFTVSTQSGNQYHPVIAHGQGSQVLIAYPGWVDYINSRPANTYRIWGKFLPQVGIEERSTANAKRSTLEIYPNPFRARSIITFSLPHRGSVRLRVYNAAGAVVRVLINERRPAGSYRVEWNGRDDRSRELPNGVYFYQLQTGNFVDTKKAVILR